MKPAESALDEIKRWADQGGLCGTAEVAQITGYSQEFIKGLCQRGTVSALKGKERNSRWRVQRRSMYLFCKNELVESGG